MFSDCTGGRGGACDPAVGGEAFLSAKALAAIGLPTSIVSSTSSPGDTTGSSFASPSSSLWPLLQTQAALEQRMAVMSDISPQLASRAMLSTCPRKVLWYSDASAMPFFALVLASCPPSRCIFTNQSNSSPGGGADIAGETVAGPVSSPAFCSDAAPVLLAGTAFPSTLLPDEFP